MGDLNPNPVPTADPSGQPSARPLGKHARQHESAPFHNQLGNIQLQSPTFAGQYGHPAFDMAAMAGALPSGGQRTMAMPSPMSPYGSQDLHHLPQSATYQPQQQYYPRHQNFDPAAMARAQAQHQQQQQQHFMNTQYALAGHSVVMGMPRPQGFPMQSQTSYSPIDPYGFGINQAPFSPFDPRFVPQSPFPSQSNVVGDLGGQFTRRASTDSGPVPSYPRGPPRKPKQAGYALWVGNLPPAATVGDLKEHFSRDATHDILSVFLMKSNCAFVNYRSEAACAAAMNRFHDSRFHGVRLVVRLRRGSTTPSPSVSTPDALKSQPTELPEEISEEEWSNPIIVTSRSEDNISTTKPEPSSDVGAPPSSETRVAEKYFIVKSLTAQDLEASVRNGVWATQKHNEDALQRAYETADNVYLIFSANKSGEYFGYAKMTSPISGEPVNLSTISAATTEDAPSPEPAGTPQSIPTPATATAPKGRIIDDSARGTIYWEAIAEDEEEGSLEREDGGDGQNWGRQFQIDWLSTSRLPFYRTRGLRNPWNANREVKIARDGTELEPAVAKRLVQMFHRPSVSQQAGANGTITNTPGQVYR